MNTTARMAMRLGLLGLLALPQLASAGPNPNYPANGQLTGSANRTLSPGQSLDVRQLLGIEDNRACGLTLTRIVVEAGSAFNDGRIALEIDAQNQDAAKVPSRTGPLTKVALTPRATENQLCSEVNSLKLTNTGDTQIFLTTVAVNYKNANTPSLPTYEIVKRHIGCASTDGKRHPCYMGPNVIDVKLVREYSIGKCIEARSWAPDFIKQEIVVDDGCQGDFLVTYKRRI